jgi:hypothetical protein
MRWAANGRKIETWGAAVGYVAELPRADTESTRAIRWLIDTLLRPLAIALTAAAGTGRSIDQLNDVHRSLDRA